MKPKLSLLAIISLISLLIGPAHNATAASYEVVDSTFQFGYVPYGSTVRHRMFIINKGDSLFRIKSAASGCNCTRVDLFKKEAEPGDTIPVDIYINTKLIVKGPFEKTPRIYTNDPSLPMFAARLTGIAYAKGDITVPFRVDPSRVDFSSDSSIAQIKLINLGLNDVRIQLVSQPERSLITLTMPGAPIKNTGTGLITIHPRPQPKHSEFIDSFTFYITDGKLTRFTVPVTLAQ